MARGWESKAVEEQIDAAETGRKALRRKNLTAAEIEVQKKREGLTVERQRIVREMEQGYKRRYLVLLERALAHVDAELEKLDSGPRD
jgi:hypothetical protein